MASCATFIVSSFNQIIKLMPDAVRTVGDEVPIPNYRMETVFRLLDAVKEKYLMDNSALVKLEGDYIIVGDIHGDIHTLLRILCTHGIDEPVRYIFLGDYVDRGSFSIEVITLLFALNFLYPTRFILLRGNHEFSDINGKYGFHQEIMSTYKSELMWQQFNDIFAFLPLAAVIDSKYILLHAGISDKFTSLSTISKLDLPIYKYDDNPIVESLVWSDPSFIDMLEGEPTGRGRGSFFSLITLKEFLRECQFKCLIRGHQPVDGPEWGWEQRIITVHSSPANGMQGGYLIKKGDEIETRTLDGWKITHRSDAYFFKALDGEADISRLKRHSRSLKDNCCIPLPYLARCSRRATGKQQFFYTRPPVRNILPASNIRSRGKSQEII